MIGEPVLAVAGVSKSYGGVRALRGVSTQFHGGEVHALLGENGAGKSTLTGVCSGSVVPDDGQVFVDGMVRQFTDPRDSAAMGIAVVHQEPSLAREMSVLENIMLPTVARQSWWRRRGKANGRETVSRYLEQIGLELDLDARVADLPISQCQLVEIAKALVLEPKVLFLDEPNSSLSPGETERLFAVVKNLRRAGTAVVLISHRLGEALEIADRVTIMRDGERIWTGLGGDIDEDRVIQLISGGAVDPAEARMQVELAETEPPVRGGEPVLACEGLTRAGEFENVGLTVHAGEVLGVAGLVGAGRTELMGCLAGVTRPDAGRIVLEGRPVRWRNVRDALRAGLAMVPEDRARQGLFLGMSVEWNMTSTTRSLGVRGGPRVGELLDELQVKTESIATPVANLSGGNQQKVVIARCLMAHPKLLILDEPTRGVDVGAKAQIYRLIRSLADEGLAVLLVSSEMDEITELSDRVVVMRQGRVSAQVDDPHDRHTLMSAAFGEVA